MKYFNMKVFLVSLVVTLAWAQEEMESSAEMMERLMELERIQASYMSADAQTIRRTHFFCLDRTTTVDGGIGTVTSTEFEQIGSRVWTLFVQMPLISYLDPRRKQALMDTVEKVIDDPTLFDFGNICIGTYETYDLSYFKESILIHIYSRTSTPLDPETLTTRLNTRIDALLGNSDLVIRYPGQDSVIAFDFSSSGYFQNYSLLQPRLETSDGIDLTSLAVFIGSYGYNYTFVDGTNSSVSMPFSGQSMRAFAANTNPINYGLEAGDIVFAVFGSILLTIVGGLIILGYFIHPFFLA